MNWLRSAKPPKSDWSPLIFRASAEHQASVQKVADAGLTARGVERRPLSTHLTLAGANAERARAFLLEQTRRTSRCTGTEVR